MVIHHVMHHGRIAHVGLGVAGDVVNNELFLWAVNGFTIDEYENKIVDFAAVAVVLVDKVTIPQHPPRRNLFLLIPGCIASGVELFEMCFVQTHCLV